MIVDIHTHYVEDVSALSDKLQEDMRNCKINPLTWVHTEEEYLKATEGADKVIAFGLRAKATGWQISNQTVCDFVKRHKEKYLYFASVDPTDADAIEQLRYEHAYNGAKGVKLAPIYQGLHPLDERYLEIYSYCQKENLPILFHMGTTFTSSVPLEYSKPVHIDEIACKFPDLKMVIAHLAHPWEGETIAVIRRNKNVYADIAALYYRPWQFYNSMRLAVEYGCTHKVLFGSDFPATTTMASIRGVKGVNDVLADSGLKPVPQEITDSIIHADALAALGIKED